MNIKLWLAPALALVAAPTVQAFPHIYVSAQGVEFATRQASLKIHSPRENTRQLQLILGTEILEVRVADSKAVTLRRTSKGAQVQEFQGPPADNDQGWTYLANDFLSKVQQDTDNRIALEGLMLLVGQGMLAVHADCTGKGDVPEADRTRGKLLCAHHGKYQRNLWLGSMRDMLTLLNGFGQPDPAPRVGPGSWSKDTAGTVVLLDPSADEAVRAGIREPKRGGKSLVQLMHGLTVQEGSVMYKFQNNKPDSPDKNSFSLSLQPSGSAGQPFSFGSVSLPPHNQTAGGSAGNLDGGSGDGYSDLPFFSMEDDEAGDRKG
jgi:hypothetical protein